MILMKLNSEADKSMKHATESAKIDTDHYCVYHSLSWWPSTIILRSNSLAFCALSWMLSQQKDQRGNPKTSLPFKYPSQDDTIWMTPCPKCPWSSSSCSTGQLHKGWVTAHEITVLSPFKASQSDLLYHRQMPCQAVTTNETTIKAKLLHHQNNAWRAQPLYAASLYMSHQPPFSPIPAQPGGQVGKFCLEAFTPYHPYSLGCSLQYGSRGDRGNICLLTLKHYLKLLMKVS